MSYASLDARLVNALLGNGRASMRSLAGDLGVSVRTVSNHLSDLEERGVIEGYAPRLDYEQLGYDVTAIIQLSVEGAALPDVTDRLRGHKQVISVYEVTGEYDVIVVGKFSDTEEMNDQIKALLADSGITETSTSVVLDVAVERRQFELDVSE